MVDSMITAICYLSSLTGIGATLAYIATFFITPYNQLYFSGQSGYDDTDLSYTLAIVECVIAGSSFIIGTLAFAAPKKPSRGAILVAAIFFGLSVVGHGTFGAIRAWNLGLFDDSERTCSDGGMTGCPTTRYETVNDREIMFSEPHGGQCSFWFWEPMQPRYMGIDDKSSCNGWQQSSGDDCDQNIDKYMNWAKASSYGWRDDTDGIKALLDDTTGSVTIKKVHNMETVYRLQATVVSQLNTSIPASRRFTSQPSIAYCWYWGCSEVCTPVRYWLNRWWLYSSIVLTLVHFINAVLGAVIYRRMRPILNVKASEDVEMAPASAFIVPKIGRRRRVENPSGLLF